jgi:hypothetical protein
LNGGNMFFRVASRKTVEPVPGQIFVATKI